MSERSSVFLTSVLSSVFVLGGMAAAGYFGLPFLKKEMQAGQGQSPAVFVQLKDETIAEIRAAKTAAVEEIQKLRSEVKEAVGASGQTAALSELKSMVDSLHSEQKAIVQRLTKIDERRTIAAKAPAPVVMAPQMPPPMSPDAHTIYFAKGVSKGPKIDTQITAVLAKLKAEKGKEPCRLNIAGFSDTLGNDAMNLKLSQRRADYVAAKLKAGGYAIEAVRGWGERWLKIHTLDGADNEKNRRVVIEMTCDAPLA